MSKPIVFVSYSHKDEKEKEALVSHLSVLQKAGLIEVWFDDRIQGGADWENEIKQAIAQASVAILLVSANFLTSDFILGEEVPAFLKRRESEGLTVFPIIAKACAWKEVGWLAKMGIKPKGARPIWSGPASQIEEDLSAIAQEVATIVKRADSGCSEPSPTSSECPQETPGAKTPETNNVEIEPPYGTMHPGSRFYIERTADTDCLGLISQSYPTTIFVQAPRQMGKSSLMRRMIHFAETRYAKKTVFIDLQEFPEHYFSDEKDFLIELCLMISDALNISEAINKYWQGPRTNINKCRNYLSKHILPKVNKSLILAIDEVEGMLTCPFRGDFFGMLRTWHNSRAHDESFAKLNLFLSSSTEPYLFIDNPHQSPFNVADLISLQDFTQAEVEDLNQRHNFPLTPGQVSDLMDLIGGHPFLVRLSLYLVATGRCRVEALFTQATEDNGPFADHLRYYLLRVLQRPELREAIAHICRHQSYEENQIYHRLKGAGLVKKEGQQVHLRNKLYTRYFEDRLNC